MYDCLDQYEYSMSSAYTGELAGGPPDLAAGINGDLHLLFGELVGVVLWGYWVRFRDLVSSGLDVEVFLRGIAWDDHKR